jgi:hypothetical protein
LKLIAGNLRIHFCGQLFPVFVGGLGDLLNDDFTKNFGGNILLPDDFLCDFRASAASVGK